MRCVVEPSDGRGPGRAHRDDAVADQLRRTTRSPGRPGRGRRQGAHHRLAGSAGIGEGTVNYRLRDWLFSRQRYWGEPFPIVYDEDGVPTAARVDAARRAARGRRLLAAHLRPGRRAHLPRDPAVPQRGLGQRRAGPGRRPEAVPARDQHHAQLGGFLLVRAALPGPAQRHALVDPAIEQYWMGPRASSSRTAASTCTSAAPSTRCCTCCTRASGHKVLFDLGHVSSAEPFHKLFNQGMIQAYVYRDSRGIAVPGRRGRGARRRLLLQGEQVSRGCWARWASP